MTKGFLKIVDKHSNIISKFEQVRLGYRVFLVNGDILLAPNLNSLRRMLSRYEI